MDMQDEWLRGLRSWTAKNDSIREVWLFGSRASGHSNPNSDVAVVALPPTGNHNWAYGNYTALHSESKGNWKPL